MDRQVLWSRLEELGFRGKFLNSLKSIYTGDSVTATANGITRLPFSFCAADLGHYQVNLRLQFEDAITNADFNCELKIKNNLFSSDYLIQNTSIVNGQTGITLNAVVHR